MLTPTFYTLQQCLLIYADTYGKCHQLIVSVDMVQVDTHVHHSACMHQKHLLRFIKSKLRKEPGEVVIFRDGKYLTLQEVFESLQLTGYALQPIACSSTGIQDPHEEVTLFALAFTQASDEQCLHEQCMASSQGRAVSHHWCCILCRQLAQGVSIYKKGCTVVKT